MPRRCGRSPDFLDGTCLIDDLVVRFKYFSRLLRCDSDGFLSDFEPFENLMADDVSEPGLVFKPQLTIIDRRSLMKQHLE